MNHLFSVEFKDYPSAAKTLLMPTIPKLDDVDRRILRELRRDGRLSNAKLAEHVGLSATPCWNRVRALEESGVIEGYAAMLNQKALGLPDTVLIEVTLDRHDDDMLHRFGQALAELPEVLEAHLLTGEYDYLIKVAVAGTEGYEEFLRHKLYKLPGLRHSHSTFVLRTLKRELSVAP
ncbi:Leucine-responsive regulatory protein [Cupriavidus pinatubonensis]|uniref:Leucine-responsive regulatory protein n=2 Tax=Cupriavidus pinatubonensis TaxID=248026 RepID=A0ABN7YSP2_9BURK|nr:Leucine-responsive regulatory protein [Cupriavidus pinatubonensis]